MAEKVLSAGEQSAGGALAGTQIPMRTYMIRHGSTEYNSSEGEKIRGHLDIPLNDQGRQQAGDLAEALNGKGISMLFSSDLSRARETADIISKGIGDVPVLPLGNLRPWKFGPSIDGKLCEEVSPMIDNLVDNPDEVPEEGESFNQFKGRFLKEFQRIQTDYKNETVGIVSHYRTMKLLDAWRAGGKGDSVDPNEMKKLDGSLQPGSFNCLDKDCNEITEKSVRVPEMLFRDLAIDTKTVDKANRTVNLSLSSDAPYKRGFGIEILKHDGGAIRMGRMTDGAPLLFNHDADKHLGTIIESATDGKKLNVKAQFGDNPLAKEKFGDVLSGILKKASISYAIHSMKLRESTDDNDTYEVDDWEPYEGSLVTIPADPSVGVGRAANLRYRDVPISVEKIVVATTSSACDKSRQQDMAEEKKTTETKVEVVDEPKVRAAAVTLERERVKKINDYVSSFKIPSMKAKVAELAIKAIEAGSDFDDFRQSVMDNWTEATRVDADATAELGMSGKDLKHYSLVKAFREGPKLSGLELECSTEVAKKLGKDPKGFFIPEDYTGRSLQEIHGLGSMGMRREFERMNRVQRTLLAGNFTSAGALIGTELLAGNLIELLRNRALLFQMGITYLTGIIGNILIPKHTGASTAYWLAEGASVTESDQTFAQLGMTPHRLSADTAYDKQLLAQASLSVEALVRDDIARVLGLAKDLAGINGTGINGQPLGILNTTGVQTVTFGGAADWAHLVSFETDLATANADQLGMPQWLTTPASRGKWKTNPKIGTTFPVFLQEGDEVNGYQVNVTNQVPSDKVLFFVPSEFLCVDWAGLDVVVNPYSLAKSGQIEVTVTQWTDLAVRHPTAFVISTDGGAQ